MRATISTAAVGIAAAIAATDDPASSVLQQTRLRNRRPMRRLRSPARRWSGAEMS